MARRQQKEAARESMGKEIAIRDDTQEDREEKGVLV